MAIFQIFSKHQSRQFNIPNRYYDPVKAERIEREARIKRELGIVDGEDGNAEYKSAISGAFHSRLSPRFKQHDKSNSTIRVLLIAFILIMGALLYFKLN